MPNSIVVNVKHLGTVVKVKHLGTVVNVKHLERISLGSNSSNTPCQSSALQQAIQFPQASAPSTTKSEYKESLKNHHKNAAKQCIHTV